MNFKAQASPPINAVAVIFDLEGFSRFFNQPDAQIYVGAFINRVFGAVEKAIVGGPVFWKPSEIIDSLPVTVAQAKFMGDGMLYVLTPPLGKDRIQEGTIVALTNRLWNLKMHYPRLLEKCADEVPVVDLPPRIRFGLARGTVYELLSARNGEKEYIGFPLNLASRLQRYCPDLAFIASARLGLPKEKLEQHGYSRVVATQIKGFPKEAVIVDKNEFKGLDPAVRDALFDQVDAG
jgi:class 3 adenylate cyclase